MAAYPRLQTVSIFIICTMAVLGVAYYEYGGKILPWNAAKMTYETERIVTPSLSPVLPETTDWKKQFASADAASSSFKPVKTVAKTAPTKKLTATDQLGRNFFTNYAQLSQSGMSEDEKSIDAIMAQAASKSISSIPLPKEYTVKDISVTSDSYTAINNYRTVITAVEREYDARVDDVEIAAMAFENEDTSQLVKIDSTIKTYNNLIAKISATPVPQSLVDGHIQLLNSLSTLLYSAKSFRHMDEDPVQGFAGIKTEALGLQAANAAFTDIAKFFTIGKI